MSQAVIFWLNASSIVRQREAQFRQSWIEFHLDTHSGVAAYLQIVQQVKQALRLGLLEVGNQLPTVRQVVGEEADEEGNVVGPELAGVPFYQNWYVRMQIRIVSVRVFIGWENFAVRRNLQNYPDRLLPITRAVYGLRWTLWN